MADIPAALKARNWMAWHPEFSRKLGERGWIGMTWPKNMGVASVAERQFCQRNYSLPVRRSGSIG